MGQIATFLANVKTRVEAVQDSTPANVFARVWIAPYLDINKLLRIPRWPAGVIIDKSGSLDPFNSKIWNRKFSVTVIDSKPRSAIGEESLLRIMDIGELLITAFEYDTDAEIFNAPDDDLEVIGIDTNILLLVKTFNFTAQFERS